MPNPCISFSQEPVHVRTPFPICMVKWLVYDKKLTRQLMLLMTEPFSSWCLYDHLNSDLTTMFIQNTSYGVLGVFFLPSTLFRLCRQKSQSFLSATFASAWIFFLLRQFLELICLILDPFQDKFESSWMCNIMRWDLDIMVNMNRSQLSLACLPWMCLISKNYTDLSPHGTNCSSLHSVKL